jgi:uncharacterized protein (DUF4415 family)
VSFTDVIGVFEDENAITIRMSIPARVASSPLAGISCAAFWSLFTRFEASSSELFPCGKQPHVKRRFMRNNMKKEYDFRKGKRGAVVRTPKGKTRITIRIDDDILEWFRGEVEAAGGGRYQTLINNALREYLNQQQQPLEELLRRVAREELKSASA